MTNSSFLKKLLFALSVVFFVSCDKDFNTIGSDIVGDDIHSNSERLEVEVVAYDRPTGAVQSNNLPLNQLGILDNPVFGKTVSHFVTQVQIPSGSEKPTLFVPVIDSVYLYVPYYSTATATKTDEIYGGTKTVYELDSVYGKTDAELNLSVYRNGFYLRDTDPGASDKVQRYYSDDFAMVENLKVGEPLAANKKFKFSAAEIVRRAIPEGTDPKTGDLFNKDIKVVERLAPGIFLNLDKAKMQEILFGSVANQANLINNNVFQNYFRGLYFKVESGAATMAIPKFSEGKIMVKYHDHELVVDEKTKELVEGELFEDKTMTFDLKGNTINFYENTFNPTYNGAITTSDDVNGDSRLYVKGGAGSMAVIDIKDEDLKTIKEGNTGQKVLINEANLVFNIDRDVMSKADGTPLPVEPMRVYLYDLKNRQPIYDYYIDATTVPGNTKYNKYVFGGIEELDKPAKQGGRGVRYKVKLTHYINNIINGDSTGVKLGLVVTEDITVFSTANKLKTPFTEGATGTPKFANVNMIPLSDVQHPFGTVLYGSNIPVTDKYYDKRVKLEIYYTKPKQ